MGGQITVGLDLSTLPAGERDWQNFVDEVGTYDDRHERHFLELKSDVPLDNDRNRAKVAKFILGAANRSPEIAGRYFSGHGLMVLGVSKARVTGIPTFEMKDLERILKKFAGTPPPSWDLKLVKVDDHHNVVVIMAKPPQAENQPWPCYHQDSDLKLYNGRIYLRSEGETREATGLEIAEMKSRSRSALRPTARLEVRVVGKVHRVTYDQYILDKHVDEQRARLLKTYRGGDKPDASVYDVGAAFSGPVRLFDQPDDRNYGTFSAEIDTWEERTRKGFQAVVMNYIGSALSPTSIVVVNTDKTYLQGLDVRIPLPELIYGMGKRNETERSLAEMLPILPTDWGPKPRERLSQMLAPLYRMPPSSIDYSFLARGQSDAEIDSRASVRRLTTSIEELLPLDSYSTSGGGVVLVTRDPDLDTVRTTWEIRVKRHNDVYTDELTIAVSDAVVDMTGPLSAILERSLSRQEAK